MRISDWSSDVCSSDLPRVVQPLPFSKGKTAVEESSNLEVTEERNPMFEFKGGASLADIVKAVNAIGASPADLVAILEAMKRSEERRVGKECVSRVDLGGRRIIKKKNNKKMTTTESTKKRKS